MRGRGRGRGRGTQGRRGIALAVVVMAIVLIGAMIAGAFFGSMQEMLAGRNAVEHERALAVAELGLNGTLVDWEPGVAALMAVGSTTSRVLSPQDGATVTTVTTKLNPLTFWIIAEGRTGGELDMQSRRRVGAIVRLDVPEIDVHGALTVRVPPGSEPVLGGTLLIDGSDMALPAWSECPARSGAIPGLVTNDSTRWRFESLVCADGPCIRGAPPVAEDVGLGDPTSASLVERSVWDELTTRATIALADGSVLGDPERPFGPVVADGRCDRSAPGNWGDPGRTTPCATHFPVIHALGDLHLAGGQGQGVLLVEGTLTLSGDASFHGPVFVRGGLRTDDPGGTIIGAAWVEEREDARSTLKGGGAFLYSRCALLTALAATARPFFEARSWVEIP